MDQYLLQLLRIMKDQMLARGCTVIKIYDGQPKLVYGYKDLKSHLVKIKQIMLKAKINQNKKLIQMRRKIKPKIKDLMVKMQVLKEMEIILELQNL